MNFLRNNLLKLAVFAACLLFIFQSPADKREKTPDRLIESTADAGISGSARDSQLLIYKKVRDSLESMVYWKKVSLEIPIPFRSSPLGTTQIYDFATDNTIVKSFFTIKGFAVKPNANIIIEKDNYFLERFTTKQTSSGAVIKEHISRKKINVRPCYLYPGDKGLTLLIPVSNGSYKWLKTIMDIMLWIILGAFAWFFGDVLRVLRNIAEGKPFLPENSRYLSRLGWMILVLSLCSVLVPLLIRLTFLPGLPREIYYPFWSSFFDVKWTLLVGIIILVTARAFKHGYQIQKEQDLTV